MCEIKQTSAPASTGGVNLSMTCKTSGKPITIANKYGMFCADKCDLQANKNAAKQLILLAGSILR